MGLTPRQQRFIDRFLPGVIDSIQKLGAGEFEGREPELDCIGTDKIVGVAVRFSYTFGDGMSVEIRSRWRLRAQGAPFVPPHGTLNLDDWERYSYALHYGRSFLEVVFRFDLDDANGYHVHILPNTDRHTPVDDVTPDTRDLPPIDFVKMVANHRRTGGYPVKMKNAPGVGQRPGKRKKR